VGALRQWRLRLTVALPPLLPRPPPQPAGRGRRRGALGPSVQCLLKALGRAGREVALLGEPWTAGAPPPRSASVIVVIDRGGTSTYRPPERVEAIAHTGHEASAHL
jgi:hypothetical protein